ncbi:MotA/TolQ/ExbB proton channel family protein [Helicobacter himalayensis]|uniref:MotA/TolQ/ExbB proton channel family protein n=1 Tax=Helicobacter himalayensis TaxID=1591088 RepID=UPI003D6ED22B
MEVFFTFIAQSTPITLIIISWLGLYLFLTLWVYIYKTFSLGEWLNSERHNLDMLLANSISVPKNTILSTILNKKDISNLDSTLLQVWKVRALQQATKWLVLLSIISSTAPFIGLFGTVVEILEAFSQLGGGNVSFDIIAPIISKALVATACGILTAIPAYSFYLLLKRKAYDLGVCIQMQINLITNAHKA